MGKILGTPRRYKSRNKKRVLNPNKVRDVNFIHPGAKRSEDMGPLLTRNGTDTFKVEIQRNGKTFTRKQKMKYAEFAVTKGSFYNPAAVLAARLSRDVADACDPVKQPSKVKEWKDMTEDERAAIKARLGV